MILQAIAGEGWEEGGVRLFKEYAERWVR